MPVRRDAKGRSVAGSGSKSSGGGRSGGGRSGGGRSGVKVKDVDKGFRQVKRNLRKFQRSAFAKVGIQGSKAAETRAFEMTNVTLALVHEFGSKDGKIPQRSFIRSTLDRNNAMFTRMLSRVAVDKIDNIEQGIGLVGAKAVAEMRRTIDNSIGIQANAKSTEERKGGTKPLIHTSQLKNAITWKVIVR